MTILLFSSGIFGCSVCDCGETGPRDFPHRSIADVDFGGDFGGGSGTVYPFLGAFHPFLCKKGILSFQILQMSETEWLLQLYSERSN